MAPVPPKLQLAFDIFAATNVATSDPVGKRSAADGAARVAALEAASGIRFRALSINAVYYQMEKALGL